MLLLLLLLLLLLEDSKVAQGPLRQAKSDSSTPVDVVSIYIRRVVSKTRYGAFIYNS